MPDIPFEISELLARWGTGDKEALRVLFPLIYKDLRRLAHHQMRQQRPDHTLQPTALVHEAYMRLENRRPAHFQNRNHFVAVCALLMRQVLVQYERVRLAEKRGGSAEKVTLDDALCLANGRGVDLIALDDALIGLAGLDPQQSRIVELRFLADCPSRRRPPNWGFLPPPLNGSGLQPESGYIGSYKGRPVDEPGALAPPSRTARSCPPSGRGGAFGISGPELFR